MKESMWGFGLVLFGVILLAFIFFVQRMTKTNEEDFYLGSEILSASMIDAIDYGTYKASGEIVMSKEKFVEVFLRRFSESVSLGRTYKIDFYDIHEYPPKASVRVRTETSYTLDDGTAENEFNIYSPKIDTLLSGVLETAIRRNDAINASQGIDPGKPLNKRNDFE